MCGFLAEYTFHDHDPTQASQFRYILAMSKNRGPDSTIIHSEKYYQLGFNRLAILDLSEKGNQPKYSPSRRYHVVFNGEIYNYKVLKKRHQLTHLQSTSDTEVLVHLLDLLGIDKTVKALNGMFAIAIIDNLTNDLYLIRDFAGIKPLFYGVSNHGVVAASQFNQVFKHEWFKKDLDLREDVMKAYFGLGYMQSPDTIYKHIFQVNPGEYLRVNSKQDIKVYPYKNFNSQESVDYKSNDKQVSLLSSLLGNSVKQQLQSDVPLSSFLSGGIDSPLITAIAKKHEPDIRAFTVSVKDKVLDESLKASAYAKYLDVQHEISTFDTTELLEYLDKHFEAFTEPFGDYSSLPTFLITKKAKINSTVMLSGDGGDELFFGYPRMLDVYKNINWFYLPYLIRKPIIRLTNKLKLNRTWGPYQYKKLGKWVLSKHLQIFEKDLNQMFPDSDFPKEVVAFYDFKNYTKKKLLPLLRINEFYCHLQRILIKVDRMSMANSLEVRVPLLDLEVIEQAFKYYPMNFKTHKDLKSILKKLIGIYYPKLEVNHDKKGFTVPIELWLRDALRDDVHHVILDTPIYGESKMNSNALKHYVKDFYDNKHHSAWGVWHIYSWQKWAINEKLI